ncbi:MAG TPA: hypothetical protein VHU15_08055 [Stellaceae bacterium]|jgi:hypothetical protein|nr:hypothetical protein [Stellaceae bacterium]
MDEHEFVIEFGRGGSSDAYRRAGWSEPEPRHTWTIGAESALEFPRPTTPGTYTLVLELGPFVWKERLPVQHLSVLVNGSEVSEFEVSEASALECAVPWSLIEGREWVSLIFRHPDAARPVDINGVPDHRELALAFETLSLFRQLDGTNAPEFRPELVDSGAFDINDLPLEQLMMRFESLGENCEFGLAQRRCGAEPLGLLRFASAPLPVLLAALKARFEGVGDSDQIEIRVSGNHQEYLVIDRRYGFLYHPWVLVGEADPEDIRRREEKRLPFLKRKLIEDLTEARKIFVYRGMRRLPQPLVLRLVTALREYGPATLLWVELQDDKHPAGTVEPLTAGLLKGYIDRFAPGENAHALSLDCWIALCRNACRLAGALENSAGSPP